MEPEAGRTPPGRRDRQHLEAALAAKGYTLSDVSLAQLGARQHWLIVAIDSSGAHRPVVRLVGTAAEVLASIDHLPDPA